MSKSDKIEIPQELNQLQSSLNSLYSSPSLSQSKVQQIVKQISENLKYYKMSVYLIEKLVINLKNKVNGIYVIDAILRKFKRSKDKEGIIERLEKKLTLIMECVKNSNVDYGKLRKVVFMWKENGLVSENILNEIFEKIPQLLEESKSVLDISKKSKEVELLEKSPKKQKTNFSSDSLKKQNNDEENNLNPLDFDYEDSDDEAVLGKRKRSQVEINQMLHIHTIPDLHKENTLEAQNTPVDAVNLPSNDILSQLLMISQNVTSPTTTTPINPINPLTMPLVNTFPIQPQMIPFQQPIQPAPEPFVPPPIPEIVYEDDVYFDPNLVYRRKQYNLQEVLPDQLKILSRTLFVPMTASAQDLFTLINSITPNKVELIRLNNDNGNAFVKFIDRDSAERIKFSQEFQKHGIRVNWGCGFGPKNAFDRRDGVSSVQNLRELTEMDIKWIDMELIDFLPNHIYQNHVSSVRPFCFGGIVMEEPTGNLFRPKSEVHELFIPDGSNIKVQESGRNRTMNNMNNVSGFNSGMIQGYDPRRG